MLSAPNGGQHRGTRTHEIFSGHFYPVESGSFTKADYKYFNETVAAFK